MRLHHFFIDTTLRAGAEIHITDTDLVHQLKQVFRYAAGDQIVLLDNSGFEYLAEIVVLTKEEVTVNIISKEKNLVEPRVAVHLYMSLIKKDNFEWILEKATELGVIEITPIISRRTEKKDFNQERAIKIIREASEQSGRGVMPVFHETISLEDAVAKARGAKISLHFSDTVLAKQEFVDGSEVSLFVGPEGGWSPEDLEVFKNSGVELRGMGKQTLRAETAVIAGLSVILI